MAKDEMGRVCPPSVVRWLNSPLRNLIQNPWKIMGEYAQPGDAVIDLGCGGGFFTVALAEMVGGSGRVIAVDLQEEMLNFTRKLAAKKDVLERITLHQCKNNDIGLSGLKVDFVLAFYVVHEVPDRKAFLRQVSELLKPNAHFMMIEPKHHVTATQFERILNEANSVGLKQLKTLRLILGRGMLFGLASLYQTHSG